MTDPIESRVFDIIAKSAGVDREKITAETTLKDLGLGSLDAIEVIFDIEEAFDIHLPDQDANLDADTVSGLVTAVRQAVASATPATT
ncbi:acyl carrier protein [Pinirhizobacter sp.]|jgi:acyl carrier protein|uniref:acyl carrier protein n=1 Tax=Pinirhizobacter sp. TaxID=2950432 RepID=UPI002F40F67C